MTAPEAEEKRLERIFANVVNDENTLEICNTLGLEFDEYVRLVMHYAMNPGKPPELLTLSPEKLEELGHQPLSGEAMYEQFKAIVDELAPGTTSDFEKVKRAPVALQPAAAPVESAANPSLKSELERQLRGGRTFTT